jgi:hypothetical protein
MFIVELTNKGAEHAVKCLLVYISKVKVEVEDRRRRWCTIKSLNSGRAKNRLAASRDPIKPQEGVSLCLPSCKRITL